MPVLSATLSLADRTRLSRPVPSSGTVHVKLDTPKPREVEEEEGEERSL